MPTQANQDFVTNFLNDINTNGLGALGNQIGSALISSQTSAIDAERAATAEANAFNAAQAALNRQFQASSAERSMQFEAAQAEIARQFSASEAQKQRDFETLMSNTSYQRAVKDLEAAGLSPLLLYQNLNGASTPSGATAQSSMAKGSSASGATASGYKADISKAKSSDLGVMNYLVPLLAITGISSALSAYKASNFSNPFTASNSDDYTQSFANWATLLTGNPVMSLYIKGTGALLNKLGLSWHRPK